MTTRRLYQLLFSLSCTFSLTGCGILGVCTNSCPPGWVHASFDCGCMQATTQPGVGTPTDGGYYVIRRYTCRDRRTDAIRPECDVSANASSCQAAVDAVNARVSQVEDPCRICVWRDEDRYADGSRWVHGGPCEGWTRAGLGGRKGQNESSNFSSIPLHFYASFVSVMRAQAVAPRDNSVATCRQECERGNTPYCFRVRVTEARDQVGLRRLQELAAGNPAIIPASEMRAAFGVAEGQCDRGDIKFEGGYMANVGRDVCYIVTSIPDSDVTIRVPALLRGKWTSTPAVAQVVFDDPRTRATLRFSHEGLNRDWGGDIVALFSERNAVGFSVGVDSCVRADLN
jgi:hypothetical protein